MAASESELEDVNVLSLLDAISRPSLCSFAARCSSVAS